MVARAFSGAQVSSWPDSAQDEGAGAAGAATAETAAAAGGLAGTAEGEAGMASVFWAGMVLLSCLLAFLVNLSTFLVIGKTSPVSYQVQHSKRVALEAHELLSRTQAIDQ